MFWLFLGGWRGGGVVGAQMHVEEDGAKLTIEKDLATQFSARAMNSKF